MLPYPGRSFQAYRLLQEYFAFPEKYLFFDLGGLEALRSAGFGNAIEIIVPIGTFERGEWRQMLEAGVSESTIRLGCTPIVNLFPQVAEPLLLTQRRHEYTLVPDAHRRVTTEVFSIDDVVAVSPNSGETQHFEPLYSHRHCRERRIPRSGSPIVDSAAGAATSAQTSLSHSSIFRAASYTRTSRS